jgi:hypothetical protein
MKGGRGWFEIGIVSRYEMPCFVLPIKAVIHLIHMAFLEKGRVWIAPEFDSAKLK